MAMDGHPPDVGAPTIDQVRELLFGREQRTLEAQLRALRSDMEQMQADYERRLSVAEGELRAAILSVDAAHRERFGRVGDAIQAVGQSIKALADG